MLSIADRRFIQPRGRSPAAELPTLPPPAPDESMQAVLGRRLEWLRLEQGLSRHRVASRLGLSARLVERHERGTARLEPLQVMAYARFYGVRISFLFSDPPEAPARA